MSAITTAREGSALHGEKSLPLSQGSSGDATLPRTQADVVDGTYDGESTGVRKSRLIMRIRPDGESGRRGLHPVQFLHIVWRSTSWLSRAVNILWPFVPAAIGVYYGVEEQHTLKFILAYIAMVPCANLIGFAGQELARKMPHVLGVLVETTLASLVEIILFMVLLVHERYVLLQGAILGSILANMLLCLGACFIAAGIRRPDATFHETISEAGSGLLLTAGVGLAVPAIFKRSVTGTDGTVPDDIDARVRSISHAVAVLLLLSYVVFVWFQTRTHHGFFTEMFEHDEERNHDREKVLGKNKLTLTECIVALVVSIALVTLIAIALVMEIPYMIDEHGITDPFMGLILVPLVEKAAEHLTAVDEAWDNQMNFALAHCIGATLQTALLNTPLVVIVGWGLDLRMSLNFEIFDMVMLLLAIITVGNFLRDQKSNYLEGFLCIVVYVAIAVAAFYYPTSTSGESETATTVE